MRVSVRRATTVLMQTCHYASEQEKLGTKHVSPRLGKNGKSHRFLTKIKYFCLVKIIKYVGCLTLVLVNCGAIFLRYRMVSQTALPFWISILCQGCEVNSATEQA